MVRTTLTLTTLSFLFAACGGPPPEAENPAPAPAEQPAEPAGEHQAHGGGEHAGHHAGGEHHGHQGGEHGGHHAKPGADHECGVVGHRFEDAERFAQVFDDPQRDAWQKPQEVVRVMQLAPGQAVADIGAGTGYFMPHLSKAVGPKGKVLALDIEPDMVRHMKERAERDTLANVEVRQVAPDDPRLPAAGVDRILIVNTWHHIADRSAYARKLEPALRPGGAIYIVDFTLETERGPPRDHRLAPDAVIADLEAAGLEAELVDESLPDQYIVRARAPGN
jgi:predicted methyltransferase